MIRVYGFPPHNHGYPKRGRGERNPTSSKAAYPTANFLRQSKPFLFALPNRWASSSLIPARRLPARLQLPRPLPCSTPPTPTLPSPRKAMTKGRRGGSCTSRGIRLLLRTQRPRQGIRGPTSRRRTKAGGARGRTAASETAPGWTLSSAGPAAGRVGREVGSKKEYCCWSLLPSFSPFRSRLNVPFPTAHHICL